MSRVLSLFFIGVALLSCALGVRAQSDSSTAAELMRSSGMWRQLADIAPQVQVGFLRAASQSARAPTASEKERLALLITSAYSPERLRSAALASIEAGIDSAHVPALRRWYASETGRAITAMEEAASALQNDPQTIIREGTELLSSMPADQRALLEELVVITRTAETMMQLMLDTAWGVQVGLQRAHPQMPGVTRGEMESALGAQRPQLLRMFAGLMLAQFAKMYAGLQTPDLRDYTVFLKSGAGQHFTDLSIQALVAAMADAATSLGRGLPGAGDGANT
jgi:hypothetical protein